MPRFLLHWLVTAIALGAAAYLVPGIHITSGPVLIIAALVLGFVNAIVRPVLVVLTLPLTVLTLGIFFFIVNGAAFGLAAALVPGFTVASLGSAILGAVVVALVSSVFTWLIRAAAFDAAVNHGSRRG
jgi:putative membrane protein